MAVNLIDHITAADEARFWAKVDRSGNGCWNWIARVDDGGYGYFHLRIDGKPKRFRATHIALAIAGKPRIVELFALH